MKENIIIFFTKLYSFPSLLFPLPVTIFLPIAHSDFVPCYISLFFSLLLFLSLIVFSLFFSVSFRLFLSTLTFLSLFQAPLHVLFLSFNSFFFCFLLFLTTVSFLSSNYFLSLYLPLSPYSLLFSLFLFISGPIAYLSLSTFSFKLFFKTVSFLSPYYFFYHFPSLFLSLYHSLSLYSPPLSILGPLQTCRFFQSFNSFFKLFLTTISFVFFLWKT